MLNKPSWKINVNEWRAIAFAGPHYGTYPLVVDNLYFVVSSYKCTNVVNLVWRLQNEKYFAFSLIFPPFGPSNKSGLGKSRQIVDFMFTFKDFWFLDVLYIKRTSP